MIAIVVPKPGVHLDSAENVETLKGRMRGGYRFASYGQGPAKVILLGAGAILTK